MSPILAPSELLAEFPPVLLTCGEKDPFVDDTVIFAGRLREAKKARKAEIGRGRNHSPRRKDRELLNENEEDWVRVAIIEGWSHGFLQMSTIMPEARDAINGIADWMNEAFARASVQRPTRPPNGYGMSETETETTDDGLVFVPKRKRENGLVGNRSSAETLTGRHSPGKERVGSPGTSKPVVTSREEGQVLVSEAELLKRRRVEAVLGMAG